MNIKKYKLRLRKNYRRKRENMVPILKEVKDKKILKNLCILNAYKESKLILTYVSKNIEVDTYRIINKCWEDGKEVAVPACKVENKSMDFYKIKSLEDLEKGTFGLLEPILTKCEKVCSFNKALCIVPGFCFDQRGYRLGYGYGYYDRFLNHFNRTSIGICYSNFIRIKLPCGKFDKTVDYLVTDSFIKQFCNN